MGKGNKKSKGSTPSAPKCTCDHPYKCSCGNRPERPSKGHKWDPETQQWGGKGHKQKGASGQTSTVGQEAKITSVGKTQVAQWQRLPSQLLREVCQKQKRPPPKFKEMLNDHKKTKFKVRVIVPDQKDRNKDLILVPASPVENEEQAKEEAALLALLQLTPNLPHERKLPEPYKTTWLAAIEAKKGKKTEKVDDKESTEYGGVKGGKKASSNTNLILGNTFLSHADKRKQIEEKKRARNARIRKHEAIRMANRNHPVFLSATLRQQIQKLLKGDANLTLDDPAENDDDMLESFESDRQAYVEERLHQEGFTKRQARQAFLDQSKTSKHKNDTDEEDMWESLYEDCLQWLCIHLEEDQLPEGFDPRGATLEVVSHPGAKVKNSEDAQSISLETKKIVREYGLPKEDAAWLCNQDKGVQDTLWGKICEFGNVSLSDMEKVFNPQVNREVFEQEMEAIEAIFPWVRVITSNGQSVVTLKTNENGEDFTLSITLTPGQYPSKYPERIFFTGNDWLTRKSLRLHVEIVKFVSTLPLGVPILFDIYSQIQLLLQTVDDLEAISLIASNQETVKSMPLKKQKFKLDADVQEGKPYKQVRSPPKTFRRPRTRGHFWATPPEETPPAVAFPSISKELKDVRSALPAGKARSDFLARMKEADSSSRVVLVTGDTGCGKTTQIPQFILEEAPKGSKIVVAQPRRLAATGVAGRVAQERGEQKVGTGSVGYVVRGDSAFCKSTRLLFCTFGILLRQLQCDDALNCITHIVIDEVHERNLDGDVLMALLRESLTKVPHLRIVLMSATLDADRFAAYWGNKTPRMHIPGRTFPVQDYMLEDVLEMTGYIPPKKKKKKFFHHESRKQNRKSTPWDDSEMSDTEMEDDDGAGQEASTSKPNDNLNVNRLPALEERLNRVDQTSVDYDMLGNLVKYLVRNKEMGDDGSILVFLPGAPEINQAKAIIGKIAHGMNILLLPLHGGLQPKDQNIVFRPAPNAVKVILSTNVAETSITIPDCTVVIDSCREKQSSYDPSNRMPLLLETFASKASLKQRRGRAGRVRAGKCYKLISKATYSKLRDHTAPEITRCALDQTLLSLLFLGVERGNGQFMRTLLDPPEQESIDAATFSLWNVGALEQSGNGNGLHLTPLGMHLAGIPAPPVVGKILIMGSILGCRRAALAMAAGISVGRSPFLRIDTRSNGETIQDMKNKQIIEERAKIFELCGNSDHAMLALTFMQWESLKAGGGERKRYCEKMGLSFTGMRDILQLANQYDSSLASAGYVRGEGSDRNAKSFRILRTCAISSMAPGQLVRLQRPSTKYADTAEGAREKDGVARELKFFIRNQEAVVPWKSQDNKTSHTEERVFMHPSSSLFSTGNYSCPWLVYHSMVKTSKPFLRDATECSAYALLLFGGQLDVEARNGIIVIDNWVKLSANARIGALIRGLRSKMDDLLEKKIRDPKIDISGTPEMNLIVKLLVTDGLGN